MNKSNNVLNVTNLTEQEFKDAFQTIKSNKAPGFDEISSNVIQSSYMENYILHYFISAIYLLYMDAFQIK